MERLSTQDMSMLWPDDFGWPQDIGALAILDGQGAGIDAVRRAVEARLHIVPRFRQVLHIPRRGLGWPLWVDAARFDLTDHVRIAQVMAPGDETQLLRTVERLRRRRLDRSRPLWEMWLLTGLADGRVAIFVRAHHAIADGVAGIDLFGRLFTPASDVDHPPWRPAPVPSSYELFTDNVKRRVHAVRQALAAWGRPIEGMRRVRRLWPWMREIFGQKPATMTSFNQPLGPGRTFTVIRESLDMVKKVAHAHDATVNDVLVSAMAGGLRDLLLGRGERVDGVVLRTVVPVSLHGRSPRTEANSDGAMFVSLPVGESDPVRRLKLIVTETRERKRHEQPDGGVILRNSFVQRRFMRYMATQRWVNLYVANLPGPTTRLCLAGTPLREVFPIVPLTGNITLGVGALSYAGQFTITVVADLDSCPDAKVFADGMRDVLHSLSPTRLRP